MASGKVAKRRRGGRVNFGVDDDIPLDPLSRGISEQRKLGPIARKRQTIRGKPPGKSLRSLRLGREESKHGRQSTDSSNLASALKLKKLGMKLSIKKSNSNTTSKPLKSPSALKGKGGKFPNTLDQDFHEEGTSGLTSLHYAAQSNNVSKVNELINQSCDIDQQDPFDNATPLHMTARYNCPEVAELLIQHGANVFNVLTNGHTALHVCCRRGFAKVVTVLLKTGKADVNATDKDHSTPLHQAMLKGDIEICTILVENGANVHAKDINYASPIMQAAQCGYKDCVQYLLSQANQKGTKISTILSSSDNEGNTALHLAVSSRHINTARALIERGALVNFRKSTNGFTPLHQAAVIGEEALVQMLINQGAETEMPDREQMTPLHRAAMYNRVEAILILIRQGLYLDAQDEDLFTPLLCAAWKGQSDAGRSLLRYGANIKALDKQMKSCLHWAAEMQHYEFAQMLFEHGHGGEDIINWKDSSEQTALHYAAEVGNLKVLELLIDKGAHVMGKDNEEKTPLHIASGFGHFECVEALLQANPVPLNDDDNDDMTPLLLASQNGHHRVVKFLIKNGADIETRNDDRRSALCLGAHNNEIAVMRVLLNNNAKINASDIDQNSPLHLAAQAGHDASTKLLLESGADLRLQNVYGMYPLDLAIENKHEGVANAILSCNSWQVAMNNYDRSGHSPMRRLIAQLPEAALLVMNQCVTKSHSDKHHPDLQISYDYRYIDPGPDDISYDKNNVRFFALETMVKYNREQLLAHNLSQTSMTSKWQGFARYFNYGDLILYFLFIVLINIYLKMIQSYRNNTYPVDTNGCPLIAMNNGTYEDLSGQFNSSDNGNNDGPEYIYLETRTVRLKYAIALLVLTQAFFQVFEIISQKLSYLTSLQNYMHWMMFVSTCLFIYPPYRPPCNINWITGTIAVFISWMNFIFVLSRFDFFGLYVAMFYTTLKSLLKAMCVYIFFVIGFGMAFFMCFQSTNPSFNNEWNAIITTFVMTIGEINKSDLLDEEDISLYPFLEVAQVLLVIFLFLMPMVLINLTIGISVGDIEQILESSYIKRFSLQVSIILNIEKRLPRRLQRAVWIPTAVHCPNKKATSILDKIRRLILGISGTAFLLKSKRESDQEITVQDVMKEVKVHEVALHNLSLLMQQQGKILCRIAEKHDIKVNEDMDNTPIFVTRGGEH